VIVADTGAIIALLDADDRHHRTLRKLFEADPHAWVLPWAILAEVDYLALSQLGLVVELAFLADLSAGAFAVEWGEETDLTRAHELARRHRALKLGLVDGVVMAVAERLEADAIATLDERHFSAVAIRGGPKLVPRDL
jgi:predicted nucleic acid-binding protein